jgi:uncharacterized protein YndB with AHSA1/START domain
MSKAITVKTVVPADIDKVWEYWNSPEHIKQWAFASDDWECPKAEADLRVGGKFLTTMAAKDKSSSLDVVGEFTAVEPNKRVAYTMADGRKVDVEFTQTPEGVEISETFDMENENTEEFQRSGWQSMLDNFKKHVTDESR